LLGAAAILVATLGYALGAMLLRRHLADIDSTATMGACLVVAAILLLPVALLDPPTEMPSSEAIGSIVLLGFVCTAGGLALYGALILMVGAGRALLVTYMNPIVATALGVAILGERPGPGALLGLALILAGSWVASRGSSKAASIEPVVATVNRAEGTISSAPNRDKFR
jgi:drug/metabolite transporter (DMT)-like permease